MWHHIEKKFEELKLYLKYLFLIFVPLTNKDFWERKQLNQETKRCDPTRLRTPYMPQAWWGWACLRWRRLREAAWHSLVGHYHWQKGSSGSPPSGAETQECFRMSQGLGLEGAQYFTSQQLLISHVNKLLNLWRGYMISEIGRGIGNLLVDSVSIWWARQQVICYHMLSSRWSSVKAVFNQTLHTTKDKHGVLWTQTCLWLLLSIYLWHCRTGRASHGGHLPYRHLKQRHHLNSCHQIKPHFSRY